MAKIHSNTTTCVILQLCLITVENEIIFSIMNIRTEMSVEFQKDIKNWLLAFLKLRKAINSVIYTHSKALLQVQGQSIKRSGCRFSFSFLFYSWHQCKGQVFM